MRAGLVAVVLLWGCGALAADVAPRLTSYVGKINLNQATVEQLELLPGVGKKAAEKIVAYREKKPFKRIQELVRVKGFGRKKFLKLQPHLAVEGENTFRIESISHDGRHLVTRTAVARK